MIPVLIAPFVNRPDLLERMLASVDEPVERALVIDNDRTGYQNAFSRYEVASSFERFVVHAPPFHGLGYGGAINFGIMQTTDAPWWLWSSNDVVFEPGTLARVAGSMEISGHRPLVVTGGFTWGAVNAAAIAEVGLIDEHEFYPIYFDDNDFHYRCTIAGVPWIEFQGWMHGDGEHPASLAIRSDVGFADKNHVSFNENKRRYLAKWGGMPGREVFHHPWDNENLPIWATHPDPAARAGRLW